MPVGCKYSNDPQPLVSLGLLLYVARSMRTTLSPFHLLVVSLTGYLNREQEKVLGYLKAENAVLRQQLRDKSLRLNDHQRLIEERKDSAMRPRSRQEQQQRRAANLARFDR